jgi:hypothetical protein
LSGVSSHIFTWPSSTNGVEEAAEEGAGPEEGKEEEEEEEEEGRGRGKEG